MASAPPVVLSIAGSDNSAGAGIQADLKTMSALGVYGLTAITCVVAEIPGHVAAIQPVEPGIVAQQIQLCFTAFPIAAVKIGMLYSREIIDAVCDTLNAVYAGTRRRPFLVVDPVMVASSGDPLFQPEAVQLMRERLFPLADLLTPNLDEAAALLGYPIPTPEVMTRAGEELITTFGRAVLLKGGHLAGEKAVDLLCLPDGSRHRFAAPRIPGVDTHGTGCTLSAALASYLALGMPLVEAVERSKVYLTRSIRKHFRWSSATAATDALNHFGR